MRRLFAAIALWLIPFGAWADAIVNSTVLPWNQAGNAVSVTANTTSGSTAVVLGWVAAQASAPPPTAVVYNTGTVDAYCSIGTSAVTASSTLPTASIVVPAGTRSLMAIPNNTAQYIACVTAKSSTTLAVATGTGTPAAGGAGAGGGTGFFMTTSAGNAVLPAARYNTHVGVFADPFDYDALCGPGGLATSTHDCSAATATAANILTTTAGGTAVSVNVHLEAGNYYWTGAVTLTGGQRIYGDGRGNTQVNVDQGFSSAALGVILLGGQDITGTAVSDLTISFVQPTGNTSSLSACTISNGSGGAGTQVACTILSGTPANGNIIAGAGVAALTSLSSVSIAGSALTATASSSQNIASEVMTTAIGRTNFATLAASCTSSATGTGCKYPPAIYSSGGSSAAARGRIERIRIQGAWDGITATANNPGGLWLEDVEVGALDIGLKIDNGGDFCHIHGYHFKDFGFQILYPTIDTNVFLDGNTIAAQFGQCTGMQAVDLVSYVGRVQILSSFTYGILTGVSLDSNGATFEVAGGQQLQVQGLHANGTVLGANTNCQIQISGGTNFFMDTNLISPAAASSNFCATAGAAYLMGGEIAPQGFGTSSVQISGTAEAFISNIRMAPNTSQAWTVVPVSVTGGSATLKMFDTRWIANGTNVGVVSIGTDVAGDMITGNMFNGWTYTNPGNLGTYWPNNGLQSATNGLQLGGAIAGSTCDTTLMNGSNQSAGCVPTGSRNFASLGGSIAYGCATYSATNGCAQILASSIKGLRLEGQGSSNDLTLQNSAGTDVCTIATGATLLSCPGLTVSGSGSPTNGIYLPAASTVGVVGATKIDLFAGASKVGDYNDTTASTWTLAAATTINNATFKVTTLGVSTAVDTVCYSSATGLFTEEPTGTTCTVSDERKKTAMFPISKKHSLEIIEASKPISYYYRPEAQLDNTYHLGFGAQTLNKIAPELVQLDKDGEPEAVKQIELLPITWAAIQQLAIDNQRLREQIDALKAEIHSGGKL